jgi:hypothetical protein
MIYAVDLALGKEQTEDDWNDWVKLMKTPEDFFRVSGLWTMQRFKSINTDPPLYLALYTVDNVAVIGNREYKGIDGGNLRRNRYLDLITLWHRNVFDGLARAPEANADQYLLVVDGERADWEKAIPELSWIHSVGIDNSIPSRGLAVVSRTVADKWTGDKSVRVYRPIMDVARRPETA